MWLGTVALGSGFSYPPNLLHAACRKRADLTTTWHSCTRYLANEIMIEPDMSDKPIRMLSGRSWIRLDLFVYVA